MTIISLSPTRISLFGGGTDLVPYSSKYGGLVISLAINLRQEVMMHSLVDHNIFPAKADPKFYQKILDYFGINGVGLYCSFDGLIEAGLGSSASAAVAMVGAINRWQKRGMTLSDIAETAWELEVGRIGLFGGKQDQYAAAYGGFNVINFEDRVTVLPLTKEAIERLLPSMVLLYTGDLRRSANIQEGMRTLDAGQVDKLDRIKKIAVDAIDPINQGDIAKVGYLLDQAWLLKRQSNKGVSNTYIDDIYRKALEAGALGGKLLGSGGGGYMLFIVEPNTKQDFIAKMGLQHWDFSPCWQGLETRILP